MIDNYICGICEQPWEVCQCVAEYFESAELAALRQEIKRLREQVLETGELKEAANNVAAAWKKVCDATNEFGDEVRSWDEVGGWLDTRIIKLCELVGEENGQ